MNAANENKKAARTSCVHDSAQKHVTGLAQYIDDIVEPEGTLHAALGLSERARAKIVALDLENVLAAPGVMAVITAKDIAGDNDISPSGLDDEPVFATDKVEFFGQPVFAVIAKTRAQARLAASLAKIKYQDLAAVLNIDQALESGAKLVCEPLTLKRGDVEKNMAAAPRVISASMRIGGQDHFYLEGQITFALPGEDEEMLLYCSTQHPSEVQHMVAHVLGVRSHEIVVKVRRLGGGFGGKETQSNLFAVIAALGVKKTGRPVKLRLDRDEDMIATGKRHDFKVDYEAGFDENGKIVAVAANFAARAGFSADLSGPVTDRALFHADNAYYYPAVLLKSQPLKTNTVSNTAFRGFGGPQGVLAAERMIEEIAFALGKDPLEIRKANFYGTDTNNITPYHQQVTDNIIHRIVDELEKSSNYQQRRADIVAFNQQSRIIKRGIALTPVKFGISFTATWFNQGGALLHIYGDGSIMLNHGGAEMGQGLYIKVAQVVADEFGLSLDDIKITATTTEKVPNTSATAASSGSDLNGMAALDACNQIKKRLDEFAVKKYGSDELRFEDGHVHAGDRVFSFADFIKAAYMERVQLSAAGFYKTPDIHWDRKKGQGRPFFYYSYGASVSEVSIDTLSGEYQVDRVDILHDVGKSLNPAIDRGQIEGGFIQGMGWLTSEELFWNEAGKLMTHAPSTYKIPLASDVPPIFNVEIADWSSNPERTIRRSKAVGEPPLMLANSVLEALSMAVASVANYKICPRLDSPATPQRVLLAVNRLQRAEDSV
ncbi:Xanthine dehydrogenase, molybdenum binding subunit [hydrothermal vent metagenome]|uniref:Xanthine dehydrogenase, molybdenum binding subunit n=1 Tax=hydrothermal vent metagenome TaxID=652676 RepID=A0A3B0TRW6_9ZZZZ